MGIVSEWQAFGAFAVAWLGLPLTVYDLLLLDENNDATGSSQVNENLKPSLRRKAWRICRVVMEAGNFGHNKDNSYRSKYPKLVEKSITFFRRLGEYARLFAIFPADAPRFFMTYVGRRTKAVIK